MTAFAKRRLGRTPVEIGILGFGAGAIGNLYRRIEDNQARGAVNAALDHGIDYYDTAPRYGHGLSERRLGEVLPSNIVISTKAGRLLTPIAPPPHGSVRHGFVDGDAFEEHFDYSYDGIMRSFEDSRRRLRRDRIDILLVHDLGRLTHGTRHDEMRGAFLESGFRAASELKSCGAISAVGLGVNETDICEDVWRYIELDVILLAGRYTLLEQEPLSSFLPQCIARGISVVVGGPFNSGILARDKVTSENGYYDYAPAPETVRQRVRAMCDVCDRYAVPLPAAALQFPLAHEAVACVLPGMASESEVKANASAIDFPIPPAFWQELKARELIWADAPVPGLHKTAQSVA